MYELFREATEKTNTYYTHETGGSVYVDVDRVVAGVKSSDLPDRNQTDSRESMRETKASLLRGFSMRLSGTALRLTKWGKPTRPGTMP